MKIFFTFILLFIFSINNCIAIELNSKEKLFITRTSKKIELLVNKDLKYKQRLINSLNKILEKSSSESKTYTIIYSILNNLEKVSLKSHSIKHYKQNNINFEEIKNYWTGLHNTERSKLGIRNYSENLVLDNSAYEWATSMKDKSSMDHKRYKYSTFYDYNDIEKWFQERGVKCAIKNNTTSSESIAKFAYNCNGNNCTNKLKDSLRNIFDMYMNEKGLSYPQDAHYRSIVHKDIKYMGVGLSIKHTGDNRYEYYIATHYCTEFINN